MGAGPLTFAMAAAQQATNLEPLGDRVIILRDQSEEVTKGGILRPDVAKEKSAFGVVVSIGEGVSTLAIGDRVIFGSFSGYDLPADCGENLIMMRSAEVWCKVR